jgi:hypothetical protein
VNLIRFVQRGAILTSLMLVSLTSTNSAKADQRACVISEESGATVCGKVTTAKKVIKKSNENSQYRQETQEVVFALKGCKRSSPNVVCDFVVQNKGAERYFKISDTNFVDSNGKVYRSSDAQIGNQRTNTALNVKIIPDINYASTVTFNNIPNSLKEFPVLDIETSVKTFRFRNIVLNKED